jgi:hypothetical protein
MGCMAKGGERDACIHGLTRHDCGSRSHSTERHQHIASRAWNGTQENAVCLDTYDYMYAETVHGAGCSPDLLASQCRCTGHPGLTGLSTHPPEDLSGSPPVALPPPGRQGHHHCPPTAAATGPSLLPVRPHTASTSGGHTNSRFMQLEVIITATQSDQLHSLPKDNEV